MTHAATYAGLYQRMVANVEWGGWIYSRHFLISKGMYVMKITFLYNLADINAICWGNV